ncbi:MAG TPA: DivIVA domain-containing protein [Armatimonadota bacterium]|nr:DivIVA domain-containing protein [Armatimonadota bacterium]
MADITPNEIINKEFRMTLRGYATDQVDDFLQHVSDSVFHVVEENKRLRGQVDELRNRLKQYQETEDLMKNALLLAERTASETRERAERDADGIRRQAELRIQEERGKLEDLRQLRLRVITELRSVLQSHLDMLDTQERQQVNPPTEG